LIQVPSTRQPVILLVPRLRHVLGIPNSSSHQGIAAGAARKLTTKLEKIEPPAPAIEPAQSGAVIYTTVHITVGTCKSRKTIFF